MMKKVFLGSPLIATLLTGILLVSGGCTSSKEAPLTTEVLILGEDTHLTQDFKPSTITVPVGTTVTWVNKSKWAHTVTSDNGSFNENIIAGGSFSYSFTERGSFAYHCDLYDMVGMVTVE